MPIALGVMGAANYVVKIVKIPCTPLRHTVTYESAPGTPCLANVGFKLLLPLFARDGWEL